MRFFRRNRILNDVGGVCASILLALSVGHCGSGSETSTSAGASLASLPVVFEPTGTMSAAASSALAQTHAIAATNAASSKKMNCLVQIFSNDGHLLQMCEPAPGTLLFVAFSVGGKTLDERVPGYKKLSAVDLFSALLPNTAVPDALAAAQARANAASHSEPTPTASRPASSTAAGAPATVATQSVRPLDCSGCANWCDWACWSCRVCESGHDYGWCYTDAFNGAWADDNGNDDFGKADICTLQGYASLSVSSDKFSGEFSAGPQQDASAWTYGGDGCFPSHSCDENIHYSVSGSGIDVHFGGFFDDGGDFL